MKAKINTKSYIISVSLGTGCYRHIRISGKASLEELSDAILDAFDFDNDHLHAFFMNNKAWDDEHCYSSAYAEDGCPDTYNCRLQFVGLEEGKKFLYIFDFGDNWQFKCKVLKVLDEDTKTAEVIRTKGEAPKQYPEYDEDGYDDDFDEDEFEYDDEDEGITEPGELPVPVPDELYDLALRFKKAKLWDKLCDIDLFAVRLSNGQDGYCSIMGNEGSYFALALYIGEKGLLSCYRIFNGQYLRTEDERFEHMLSQDCLQVCFDNKDTLCSADLKSVQDYAKRNGVHFRGAHSYPFFQKMKPMYRPWFIDDKIDHILLREALEAALFIAEKLKNTTAEALGFTDGLVIPYVINDGSKIVLQHTHLPKKLEEEFPTPSLSASKTAKLKKLKQLNKWECKVVYMRTPVQDIPDEAPYFPAVLVAVECRNDHLLPVEPVRDYDINAQLMLDSFADELLKYKRLPKTICISDDRTYSLLKPFCNECGVALKPARTLEKADAIADSMNNGGINDTINTLMQLVEMLKKLPIDELKTMPSEMKLICQQIADDGLLEPELTEKLKRAYIIK